MLTFTTADHQAFSERSKWRSIAGTTVVAANENADACLCDFTERLGSPQPAVSHHVKVLVDIGYPTRSKRGTRVHPRLVDGSLDSAAALLVTV